MFSNLEYSNLSAERITQKFGFGKQSVPFYQHKLFCIHNPKFFTGRSFYAISIARESNVTDLLSDMYICLNNHRIPDLTKKFGVIAGLIDSIYVPKVQKKSCKTRPSKN